MAITWGTRAGQILVRLAPAAVAYWSSHGGTGLFGRVDDAPANMTISKVTISHRRFSTATLEDDLAQFSMHHLNITGGDVDNSWIESDFTALADAYTPFLTGLRGLQDNYTVISKLTIHSFPVGQNPGPAVLEVDQGALSGTKSGGALPPQCACAVTLKTAHRRHWGRIYVPGLTTDCIDGWGRLAPAYTGPLATVVGNHIGHCSDLGYPVVVFSEAGLSALEVGEVQVDDIVDIIRRRRFKATLHRDVA